MKHYDITAVCSERDKLCVILTDNAAADVEIRLRIAVTAVILTILLFLLIYFGEGIVMENGKCGYIYQILI
jgi:hypothetical protein